MTATATATRVFQSEPSAASRIKGLPVGVTLTALRTFRSNDGQGLSANLKIDGKVIGTLEDNGCGGGVWYRPSVAHADGIAVVDRLVEGWGEARAAAGITDTFMLQEALWNDLVEEALTMRDLKKKGLHVSKGEPRVRVDCGDWGYTAVKYITYPSLSPATYTPYLSTIKTEGFTHIFNGTHWQPLP